MLTEFKAKEVGGMTEEEINEWAIMNGWETSKKTEAGKKQLSPTDEDLLYYIPTRADLIYEMQYCASCLAAAADIDEISAGIEDIHYE